jgi:hypothetical protein
LYPRHGCCRGGGAFHPGELFVLAARKGRPLVGLAPGLHREGGRTAAASSPVGISLSDHLDVLADPDCRDAALEAIVAAALAGRAEWEIWELEELLPDAAALRLPLPHGYTESVTEQSPCPVFIVPQVRPASNPCCRKRNGATSGSPETAAPGAGRCGSNVPGVPMLQSPLNTS